MASRLRELGRPWQRRPGQRGAADSRSAVVPANLRQRQQPENPQDGFAERLQLTRREAGRSEASWKHLDALLEGKAAPLARQLKFDVKPGEEGEDWVAANLKALRVERVRDFGGSVAGTLALAALGPTPVVRRPGGAGQRRNSLACGCRNIDCSSVLRPALRVGCRRTLV